jgi:hypothetical protein
MLTAEAVYDRYGVSAELRQHMSRAAAIAEIITAAWSGPVIERHRLVRPLLLHDLGVAIVTPENAGLPTCRAIATEAGGNRHAARLLAARQLGLTEPEIALFAIRLRHMDIVAPSEDFTLKLWAYVDHRQSGEDIVTLRQNVEAEAFYHEAPNVSQTPLLFDVEQQIAAHYRGDLQRLDRTAVITVAERLRVEPLFDPIAETQHA